jgi:aminoglycoside phosphotransferase (APT) family kinase protein
MADDRTAVDTPSRALHYVREAFPDLDAHEARALDEGWASYPYMIDDTWVFRFPRADQVERQYRKERQFLPRLAPRVAVAVPEIECVAELSDGRTFMGHRAIHGVREFVNVGGRLVHTRFP